MYFGDLSIGLRNYVTYEDHHIFLSKKNPKKNVISVDANYKGNRLNKDIKTYNSKKDLMI